MQILALPTPCDADKQDTLTWKGSTNDEFLVKTSYNNICQVIPSQVDPLCKVL